jgi:glycosyltransferase involved in cell wall biosynthesis
MFIALVPVFNEEDNIIKLLNKLDKQVDYIIIVNDGSFDKTDYLISNWLKNKENIRYIAFRKNKGMAYVLLQGFRFINEEYATGRFNGNDVIVTIDADGQHEPDQIKGMYAYFTNNNLDVLIAKRDFSNYPSYRIIGNKLISALISLIGKFKFEDIESGFRMLKVVFIPHLLNYYIGFRYSCASEIGVIASLLKYKIDNAYPIGISYYRKRKGCPGIEDLFINIIFSLLVFLKIRMNKKCRIRYRDPLSIYIPENRP